MLTYPEGVTAYIESADSSPPITGTAIRVASRDPGQISLPPTTKKSAGQRFTFEIDGVCLFGDRNLRGPKEGDLVEIEISNWSDGTIDNEFRVNYDWVKVSPDDVRLLTRMQTNFRKQGAGTDITFQQMNVSVGMQNSPSAYSGTPALMLTTNKKFPNIRGVAMLWTGADADRSLFPSGKRLDDRLFQFRVVGGRYYNEDAKRPRPGDFVELDLSEVDDVPDSGIPAQLGWASVKPSHLDLLVRDSTLENTVKSWLRAGNESRVAAAATNTSVLDNRRSIFDYWYRLFPSTGTGSYSPGPTCYKCGSNDVNRKYNKQGNKCRCRDCGHTWGISIYDI